MNLREVAVHEIKDGKIQRERFYYNPMDLAPPQGAWGGLIRSPDASRAPGRGPID